MTDAGSTTARSSRAEPVEARGQERLDRRRHRDLADVVGEPPVALDPAERALVDEHRDELLDEQRVALGRADDRARGRRRRCPTVPEQVLDHLRRRLVVAERRRARCARVVAPSPQSGRVSSRSWRAVHSEQHRRAVDGRRRGARRRSSSVGSAQWMSSNTSDERPLARRGSRAAADGPEHLGERERRVDEPDRRARADRPRSASPTRPSELAARDARAGRPPSMPAACADDLDQRPERDAVAVRTGSGRARTCALGRDRVQELARSGATCRRPASPTTVTMPARCRSRDRASNASRERRQLGLAPDHRRVGVARHRADAPRPPSSR